MHGIINSRFCIKKLIPCVVSYQVRVLNIFLLYRKLGELGMCQHTKMLIRHYFFLFRVV